MAAGLDRSTAAGVQGLDRVRGPNSYKTFTTVKAVPIGPAASTRSAATGGEPVVLVDQPVAGDRALHQAAEAFPSVLIDDGDDLGRSDPSAGERVAVSAAVDAEVVPTRPQVADRDAGRGGRLGRADEGRQLPVRPVRPDRQPPQHEPGSGGGRRLHPRGGVLHAAA